MTKHVETIYTSKQKLNKGYAKRAYKKSELKRVVAFKEYMSSQKNDNLCYIGINGITIPQPIFA